MTGRWFSLGPPVSSTNKTDRHYITEILLIFFLLLKVVLNTIKQTYKIDMTVLSLLAGQHIHYPFQFAMYNFTFSVGDNPDYCANQDSTAYIYGDTISMNSCYDTTLTDSGKYE